MPKIVDLVDLPDPAVVDVLPIVDDPLGIPITKKVNLASIIALVKQSIHDVGDVIVTVVNVNPSARYGGTWVALGAGRCLVGVDVGDTDFDVPEKTAGAKTKAISAHSGTAVADHASHTHSYNQVPNHVHPLATGTGASGNFSQVIGTVDTTSGGTGATPTQTPLGTLSGNPNGGVASANTNGPSAVLSHAVTQPSSHSDLNVVQPSLAVYFWKRTA